MNPRFRSLIARFALLALLGNLAQPFGAAAAAPAHDFMEVCTAQGLQKLPVDDPAPAKPAPHVEHCALCIHSATHAALPAQAPSLPRVAVSHAPAAGTSPAPAPDTFHLTAAPRGPPGLSL